jgi:hypothetical protein
MKTRAFVLALVLALYPALAISQAQPAASVLVKTGKLLDVRKVGVTSRQLTSLAEL